METIIKLNRLAYLGAGNNPRDFVNYENKMKSLSELRF